MLIVVVIIALMLVGIGWQILTGKLLSRRYRIWFTRDQAPMAFWAVILLQLLFVLVAVAAIMHSG